MRNKIFLGHALDILRGLESNSIHCGITSPPYWGLRDYGGWLMQVFWGDDDDWQLPRKGNKLKYWKIRMQIRAAERSIIYSPNLKAHICALGLEPTPELYIEHLVTIFRELRRVLRDDGTLWLNLGDSYASQGGPEPAQSKWQIDGASNGQNAGRSRTSGTLKPKDLCMIPARVALALQADGWWLRNDIIWAKKNGLPESVTDRCTKMHEYLFLLTKSPKYFFDQEAIKEPAIRPGDIQTFGGQKAANNDIDPSDPRYRAGSEQWGRTIQSGLNGRNKRTVWDIAEERDPLLAFLLMNLSADQPDLLDQYISQYTHDSEQKSTIWRLATKPYKEAHFAVFPPDLVKPCILAGCPHKTCSACGAPWVRVVEKTTEFHGGSGKAGRTAEQVNSSGKWAGRQYGENIKLGPVTKTKTLGFEPTCTCQAPTIPGLVFDPFAGSGTVAEVAIQLNRHYSGCELNEEYIKLINKRLHATQRELF